MAIMQAQPFNAFIQGRQARQTEDFNQNRNALAGLELQNAPTEMAGRNALLDAQVQGAQGTNARNAANFTREGEERALSKALAEAQHVAQNPAALAEMPPAMQQRAREQLGQMANDPQAVSQWAGSMVAGIAAKLGQGPAPQPVQMETITNPDGSILQRDPTTNKLNQVQARAPQGSNGFSMTMPDGTVVQMGGTGGGIAAQDLSGPTKNRLQDAIVQSTDELDRLNSIGQAFDPKFLQLPGRLKAGALKIKDFSGLSNLTPEEAQYLDKFSTFKADSAKNLSTILNRLSGAAISPAEGERLKKGIPNDEDSPTQFIAKYRSAVKDSTRAIMRANWALKNGIGVQSVEQLSKAMPLNGIDQVYEQRANEIWQEMGGTPEAKAAAIKQANGEFGLAR
jgi:hypothetical protein